MLPSLDAVSHVRFSSRLLLLFLALSGAGSVQAMWAGMSDAELVEASSLIVNAVYIGGADVSLKVDGEILHLGVLDVENTLKGNQQEVIYIQLPRLAGSMRKSDDIFFHRGQKGLWFLRKEAAKEGIYVIDHPQRFIPEEKVNSRMDLLRKLLAK